MAFVVGQKVRCINAEFAPEVAKRYTQLPERDVVYTVRSVYPARLGPGECDAGIRLAEVHNPVDSDHQKGGELGFHWMRFEEAGPAPTLRKHNSEATKLAVDKLWKVARLEPVTK